ncbi:helix-turn-helix domain-containing protein [Pseudomarimonas salicorniae]|uniref:AraC family transcriptional regulator n=1 Tax=Pseudomarimonas salicorniae TaxID=2933270 RepID=A0ABT0GEC0_9GAMM|nr:AraC family transcriptional regulator [Lysobacter sp. CAU 1642]MCK7592899.1 AraC family transcriptional regulator [Lysobacter sp. CAU 1642]
MGVDYREWQPPAALQDRLRCAWRLRDARPDGAPQVVYPDGCCELIVHLGRPMQRWQAGQWQDQAQRLFAAQQRSAIRLRACGPLDCMGLRLQPWAGARLAGDALPGLVDQVVDLNRLRPDGGAEFAALMAELLEAEASDPRWQRLDALLGQADVPRRLRQAVERLVGSDGSQRIDALALACGLPLRTLQAQFPRWVGLSAKEFARVLRLQATLRALDAGDQALAELALASGFSDQAHATRELRRLTGLTPARLLQALREDRDRDGTVAMAAAFIRGEGSSQAGTAE